MIMKMFMSMIMIFFSIFMFFINHPITMGLLILMQTFLVCLLSGMLINSYWFSYILFLIFLGGLLVLFMYISSIASNEMFKISFINMFMFFIIFLILMMMMMLMNKFNWLNFMFNDDMNSFFNLFIFMNKENNMTLFKLYNKQSYLMTIIMIIYLFISLIAVVKITNINFGPLRSFN
uniref:NADH-ubiquinone oxidoreductase chain 6 n=1 Tax=Elymnias hypermnestra TaxID=366056 RepID=A0A0A7AIS6_9NEOP|nr:NADH dehydrogenase subunit 6 [Elymnias hypermnestra]AHH92967.1 NADH dehydrogenase subunit 6 [Elymnias hypermnestra]